MGRPELRSEAKKKGGRNTTLRSGLGLPGHDRRSSSMFNH